jgi:hypothetical protein
MADIALNLDEFQSQHILTLESRPAGFTKTQTMLIEGNSLLSSVFVKSITGSPTLDVNYFEITSGLVADERRNISDAHPIITAASSSPDQRLLTPFHNKVFCEIIVGGTGTIEFGIYITVVSSFASLLDRALKNHLEDVDLILDQGMPMVLRDPDDGKWYLAKGKEGCLTIDGSVTTAPVGDPVFTDVQATSTPGTEQSLFSFVVPALTTRNLTTLEVTCVQPSVFNLEVGGSVVATGRTGPGHPNARFHWAPTRPVAAGTTVELKFEACDGVPATGVEAYLMSSDVV